MVSIQHLIAARSAAISATKNGTPKATSNQFFGVGPITDMTLNEVDARLLGFEFDAWLEENYPKLDDKGNPIGNFTKAELARGMHRGYPADKVLKDMMREMHRYFGFPLKNKMAVGLGGGHSGFTSTAMHMMTANDPQQIVFIDTPKPESDAAKQGGFFRQSWGAQLTEMQRYAKNGNENRLLFAEGEGTIPSAEYLQQQGVKLFFGVGHETTGATCYTENEIKNLLAWIDLDPQHHHAVIDATSMLGAMPWSTDLVNQMLEKCNMFMPFQKAIGGISGYYVISLTPMALELIDHNQQQPSWAIPRQLKISVPVDGALPLSSKKSTALGPIYDPKKGQMQGGIINTYSTLAFAETTFGILRNEKNIGDVATLNQRSIDNRSLVGKWVATNSLFDLGVASPDSRGAAVTLLKVVDPDIEDPTIIQTIVAKSKQLLGYDGITHIDGSHEKGLDVARYVNAFPGSPGDYRAWIGGIRDQSDISALLDNINYCYLRAKIAVIEELLEARGESFESPVALGADRLSRADDENRAYTVLIADLIGMKFDSQGNADYSEVRQHIESKGGMFHTGPIPPNSHLETGKIHFFYQPELSRENELLAQTDQGQFDATIVAATFLPSAAKFELGGVRIGAGTANMGSASWGGGNGDAGVAPLMNTPSFNSRATAQSAFKALLKVLPNLQTQAMHDLVVKGDFDTGEDLAKFPTTKLEGKRLAVIGYGNIGREVAKLGAAFGMQVSVFARPQHQRWIESEGFVYAATIVEAAQDADVISPHTGLGPYNPETQVFSNAGIINAAVFTVMQQGAILINYDRGEVVDISALDQALSSGQISYAAVDADLFKDPSSGDLSGPMVAYRNIFPQHAGKMELLPHAAADTEHVSRVEGAKQAVDQLFDVIQYRKVTNLKGDLPLGYTDVGPTTVHGVGKVSASNISGIDADEIQQLRHSAQTMAAFWGAIDATADPQRRELLIAQYAEQLVLQSNRYQSLMQKNGLQGPFAN